MTSKFDIAFDYVIKNEGTELSTDPTDRGGVTKFGISKKFIESLKNDDELIFMYEHINGKIGYLDKVSTIFPKHFKTTKEYIENLTIDLAKWIYEKYFWLPIYEQIENQDICNYIFDMTVQHGEHKAAELTQRAIHAAYKNRLNVIDGKIGELTLSCIDDLLDNHNDLFRLLTCLIAVRESLFRCIVAHDKTQQDKLEGWLKRCYR